VTGLRARVGRPVVVAGLLVVLAGTVLRAWAVGRTWFWLDDLALVIRGQDGLGWHALTRPHVGHLMPGGRVLAWTVSTAGPYDYGVAAVETVLLYVLACLAVLRLLATLFGVRPAILVPLTYFVFSPWLVPATSWWAAGINHLPALAATAMALDAHVRYLRAPDRRQLVLGLVWITVGLVFAELAIYAYLPIVVVTVAYFTTGPLLGRVGQVWRRYRSAVVAHAALIVAYAGLYLASGPTALEGAEHVSWRAYVDNLLLTVFPSAAIGGPGRWNEDWKLTAQFEVSPPVVLQVVALAVIAAVFALTALTRDRGLRAWSLPLLQLVASLVLLAEQRSAFGARFALDPRFTIPLALGVSLALGLAFLPVVGARESSVLRLPSRLVDRWPVPALATGGFVALAVVSAATYPLLHVPQAVSPRHYFETFAASLDAHEPPVNLLAGSIIADTPVGADTRQADYDRALHPWRARLAFPPVIRDGDGYLLSDSGHLVRPRLDVARRMVRPGSTGAAESPGCDGYALGSGTTTIRLDGPVVGFAWRIRVDYRADSATPVTISYGDRDTTTSLQPGSHTVDLLAGGEYDRVGLSGLDAGADVCVTDLVVGMAVAPDAAR